VTHAAGAFTRSRLVHAALVVFALGLFFRIGYVVETRSDPLLTQNAPGMDAQVTWDAARALRGTTTPRIEPMMLSAPLHVAAVAAQQAVFGESKTVQRAISAIGGALRLVLVLLLVFRITGKLWSGVAVGLLLGAMPSLIYFDTALLKTSLDLWLLTLAIAPLLLWNRPLSTRTATALGAAAGLCLALALLSQKAAFSYAAPVFVAAGLRGEWSRRARAMVCIALAGVFVSVLAGNAVMRAGQPSEAFLPREGVDLKIGFHEGSHGHYAPLEGITSDLVGHTFESRMAAELRAGRRLTWAESSALHRDEALSFIKANPGRTVRLVARKLLLFFNDFEIKSEDYLDDLTQRSTILRLSPISFGWIFVVGMLGAFEMARERRWWLLILCAGLIGSVALSCTLAFVTWRFRVPVTIPLAVLAGPGFLSLQRIWAHARGRAKARDRGRELTMPLVVVAILAALTFWPASVPADSFRAAAKHDREVSERAVSAVASLRSLDSQILGRPPTADELVERARLLVALKRHTEAFAAAREVLVRGIYDANTSFYYLRYLVWLASYEQAARFLTQLQASHSDVFQALMERDDLVMKVVRRFVLPER
jgi:hypothetical protein